MYVYCTQESANRSNSVNVRRYRVVKIFSSWNRLIMYTFVQPIVARCLLPTACCMALINKSSS